jgi:hypothetical protein
MSEGQRALVRDLTSELVRFELAGETLATINAIGRQLAAMTAQDRERVEAGEMGVEWQSRSLSQEEARQELRQLRRDVLGAFCTMFGFDLDSAILWGNGQREIPGEMCEILAHRRQERMKGETR